ncbi:hypothetical protein CRUP_026248 [Coryphaenoides rupestris]|nr:hypothetical protein CRUP_026248 [Coryphaenoides rupestris]
MERKHYIIAALIILLIIIIILIVSRGPITTTSDTWPGGVVTTEPSSGTEMDSAGSADSVISTVSGSSVDSLQHLSAAERECLMYLEETIDSLDVEEDSGLSNDEPETSRRAAGNSDHHHHHHHHFSNDVDQGEADSGRVQKLLLHHGVPTPLLLANGSTNLPQTAPADVHEHKNPEVPNNLKALLLETNTGDLETSQTPCVQVPPDSLTDICPPAPQVKTLASAANDDHNHSAPSEAKVDPVRSDPQPETDLVLIPPPSDFMDEPPPPPQPEARLHPPMPVKTAVKNKLIDLEEVRKRASLMRTPVSPDVIHQPVPDKSVVADKPESPSALAPSTSTPTSASLPPEVPEPRSPPAVAPKPKKLPSNIILKSHKPSADANFSSPAGDRLQSDAQVRMEALRKLGLLKDDEADLDHRPSLSSPNSRKSWAAPLSPLSPPAARQTPPPPSTRPLSTPTISTDTVAVSVPSPSMGRGSPQDTVTSTPAAQATDILPVPAAFSDTAEPPSSKHYSGEATPARRVTSEPTVRTRVKSATFEHSGTGLVLHGSGGADRDESADHRHAELRNSRPRPASLGSGKDFSSVKVEALAPGSRDANARRSTTAIAPVSQSAGESQGGVSRYHGVSVVICPQAEHDEGRRKALKKLGLIKD